MVREIVQRIRNPLNALQLNIDSLEDDIARANIENSLERLKRIRNTVGELDSFLCEILRLVDLPKPQITPVNVNALVREVETFVRPESLKKEVTVKVALKENLPDIQADPAQLKQAVLNVLLNAIEACAVKGSVTLATEAKDHRIMLTITDSGAGILETDRDKIFEPFFTTKEAHAGLGLPLALEIVKRHQGRLSYTSQVGTGTTFLIFLPTKREMSRK
jgi:signal transduction histidine kinase